MRHLYANDWHQCVLCGCTRPDSELTKGETVDVVLRVASETYACRDSAVCERMKQGRLEIRQREKEHEHLLAVISKPLFTNIDRTHQRKRKR